MTFEASSQTSDPRSRVTDKASAKHYVWGERCDGWRLLNHPELSVIRERVPAGCSETRHFHSHARQFFFVLSGEATLEFDAESVCFVAGQGVHIEPGIAHRFCNRSGADVEFLVISAPATAGDRTNLEDY